MELHIEIKQNTWKPDTKVRENIVQDLVTTMMRGHIWHPHCEGAYRDAEQELRYSRESGCLEGFGGGYWHRYANEHKFVDFNEAEMQAAWKAILKAGYHIFQVREYRTWPGYVVSERDYYNGGTEVKDFYERWT